MIVLAYSNIKGGTGKTSLAVNSAVGWARQGQRVLLVDFDPQANATHWLLGKLPDTARGVTEALLRGEGPPQPDELRAVPGRGGLTVLPSTPAITGLDLALAGEVAGETTLRRVLTPLQKRFDVVVLDCPPSLNTSVLNALYAADAVVAPVTAAYMPLQGLSKLEAALTRLRERLNARTHVLGYVLFAADDREAITVETRDILNKQAPGKLYQAGVRVSTAAKPLPGKHLTAWDEGADTRGAEDYPAIMAETLARLESMVPLGPDALGPEAANLEE